jgi:hypothetical protein
MYFAVNQSIDNFDTYISFLSELTKNENSHYKSIFRNIIEEAKKLSNSKNYYSVQSDRFGIISFFADKKEILDKIDLDNPKRADYQKLLECLEKERPTEM